MMAKCYVPLTEYQRVLSKFPAKKEAIDSFIEAIGIRGIDKEESIPCHHINNETILFKLETPLGDEEEIKQDNDELFMIYNKIIKVLKYYVDIDEKYYPLIAVWIIGTYQHHLFPSYPYLYFNAMRGSGKSRLLRLITCLAKEGEMLNSLTEAVLFRTNGTLGIDEFEGVDRKGKEALRELLNSAYKKGIKVKRMRKVKTKDGEGQEVEDFEVYRPIIMANINGINDVLTDRCLTIILEKSSKSNITKKVERYESDVSVKEIVTFLLESQRKSDVSDGDVSVGNIYEEWNNYIEYNVTNVTYYTNNTNNTNVTMFKLIDEAGIDGRHLELTLPLLLLSKRIDESLFRELLELFKEMVSEKKREDITESLDVSLIDFVSQYTNRSWIIMNEFFNEFKNSVQASDEWLNIKWLGRALKRLNLIKDKKKLNFGRLIVLDIDKAQEKIRMFK
jgi:hypothetical protein